MDELRFSEVSCAPTLPLFMKLVEQLAEEPEAQTGGEMGKA